LELIKEFLNEDDHQIIIQRVQSASGPGKIKINGLTVTVGQLKNLGNHLIDFHGPHDHQMLLSEAQHLVMLDQLVNFKNTKEEYTRIFTAMNKLAKNLTV